MGKLSLNSVINVTVEQAGQGLANQNTSSLAIITSDVPLSSSYGTFGIYYDPISVAKDFGSSSVTAQMATAIFQQTPNILTGNGFLVIIPRNVSNPATAATILSSGTVDLTQLTATNYYINLKVDSGLAADVLIGPINSTSIEAAQASLNSTAMVAAGATFAITGTLTAARITLTSNTAGAASELVVGVTATGVNIAPLLLISEQTQTGNASGVEAVRDAIIRTYNSVYYFGIVLNVKLVDADLENCANLVQSIDKMLFVGSSLTTDNAGVFTTIQGAGNTNTRCLLYTQSAALAITFAAAYASNALSVDFTASNSVRTMNLKVINGFVPDDGLTDSIAAVAFNAGVDVYADFGGSTGNLKTSGGNGFFDAIYTELAFKFALITAGFNLLASVSTQVDQTETGMTQLKGAYKNVCKQFVFNGAFAPGTWTNATTFGNPADHIRNIADFGYYIYSQPIAQQSQTVRTARIAPSISIAAKSSGAIHTSDVLALIEA